MIILACFSRCFIHQRVEYGIAYISFEGKSALETIFHESIAQVEYGFQKHSSPRKIWNCYLILHEFMCEVSDIHHIVFHCDDVITVSYVISGVNFMKKSHISLLWCQVSEIWIWKPLFQIFCWGWRFSEQNSQVKCEKHSGVYWII